MALVDAVFRALRPTPNQNVLPLSTKSDAQSGQLPLDCSNGTKQGFGDTKLSQAESEAGFLTGPSQQFFPPTSRSETRSHHPLATHT